MREMWGCEGYSPSRLSWNPHRRSMFGLKTPISKHRKRNKLEDFDGIRSILAKSKFSEGWQSHVKHDGELFYVASPNGNQQNSVGENYLGNINGLRRIPANRDEIDLYNSLSSNNLTLSLNLEQLNSSVKSDYSVQSSHEIVQYDDGYFESDINDFDNPVSSQTSTPKTSIKLPDSISSKVDKSLETPPEKLIPEKIKCVILSPNFNNVKNNDLSGLQLCEKMFGIKLCQYNTKSQKVNYNNNVVKDRKIIVQDVVHGSVAERSKLIHRGDMLLSVNEEEVSWMNIDKVFQALRNKKVKLIFQLPVVIGPKSPTLSPPIVPPPTFRYSSSTSLSPSVSLPPKSPQKPQTGENIVQLITGESTFGIASRLKNSLCSVMYLTMQDTSDSHSLNDDIVYMFPHDETKVSEVRGLFLTLSGLLPEALKSNAKVSTLSHKNQKFFVSYLKNNKDLMCLAIPASKVSLEHILIIHADLERLILYLFQSLTSAFNKRQNRQQLDHLLSLTFHSLCQLSSNKHHAVFMEGLPAARLLDLPQDSKILCDEILSEFEAADFDDVEEDLPFDRRNFCILGTSLFYKGYLLCNHLSSEDLKDIQLFIQYHQLHHVTQHTIEELVIWREVYPTRLCNSFTSQPHGYEEPDARRFLLVVGMKNFLLLTLLEAGGCARETQGYTKPDPFFISQAKATLLQIETEDVAELCETRIMSERSGPSLASADALITGAKPKKEESINHMKASPKSPGYPLRTAVIESNMKWPNPFLADKKHLHHSLSEETDADSKKASLSGSESSTPVMRRQGSKLSYGSNDSAGSAGSSVGAKTPLNKSLSKAGSVFDVASINNSLSAVSDEGKSVHPIRVTRGLDNVLFHYVSLDKNEGVYICPTCIEMASPRGHLHQVVLQNFNKSCLKIRQDFQIQNAPNEETKKKQASYQEVGILFHCGQVVPCESRKSAPLQTYWVIGRKYLSGREVFVCCHESVPQTMLEMAFRMDFGM